MRKNARAMALLLAVCAAAGGATEGAEEAWGAPFENMVAGLRSARPYAAVGDPLSFRVDVRAAGLPGKPVHGLNNTQAWRLQFESAEGALYEFTYQATRAGGRPVRLAPGESLSLDLPVMTPGAVGRFRPEPGLTELPGGRYRVWAFLGGSHAGDIVPVRTLSPPDRLITNAVEIRIGEPEAGAGWTPVGTAFWREQYRQMEGHEEIFTGTLESIAPPPQGTASTLMRDHGYRLGDRLLAGRGIAELDALVGRPVRIRGKRLDMNLSGMELREIVPGWIRSGP